MIMMMMLHLRRWQVGACNFFILQAGGVYRISHSVAGLQRLTQFPRIQAQRKPVTHLSISSIFGSEANAGLRLPPSAKASASPVVDC